MFLILTQTHGLPAMIIHPDTIASIQITTFFGANTLVTLKDKSEVYAKESIDCLLHSLAMARLIL